MIKLINAYRKLTRSDIDEFEHRNAVELPNSYRNFLLESNGGRPVERNIIDVPGWVHKCTVVSYFFGLESGDTYDLLNNWRRYRDRIPYDSLPIGDDVAGNLFCLELGGENKENILFWDHEQEAEESYGRSNVYHIARDMPDLLAKLRSDFCS